MNRKYNPICGNCGKPYSEHYHEDEVYCFSFTNGDLFSSEPSCNLICEYMETYHNDIYLLMINKWKELNGHLT